MKMKNDFYVLMLKPADNLGLVYPDLSETTGEIFLTREKAERALLQEDFVYDGYSSHHFQVVRLLAVLPNKGREK